MMSWINRLNYFINALSTGLSMAGAAEKAGLVRLAQELDKIGIETAQTLNQSWVHLRVSVDF